MVDNVVLNAGSGGAVTAAKDVSGVLHQRVLNESLSVAGTPVDVSPTAPMPVTVDTGTLMQRIEMLELLIGRLLAGNAGQMPNAVGQTRVSVDAGTLTTITTLTKLGGFGSGFTVPGELPGLSQANLAYTVGLRRGITVT